MAIAALDINPLRFFNNENTIDWDDTFPNEHNIQHRVEYFKGEYPQNYYNVHLIDNDIILEFRITGVANITMTANLPNGSTASITPTNISPSGWTEAPAWRYVYTPASEGIYYFELENFISDKIYVVNRTKFRKELIRISYYNSFNDFETVFYTGTTLSFNPVMFVSGVLKSGIPTNEKSTFTTDKGEITTRRSIPVPTARLIFETHRTMLQNINMVFSCDRININGVTYQPLDELDYTEIEQEDMFLVTVNLSETNYDYSRKII